MNKFHYALDVNNLASLRPSGKLSLNETFKTKFLDTHRNVYFLAS